MKKKGTNNKDDFINQAHYNYHTFYTQFHMLDVVIIIWQPEQCICLTTTATNCIYLIDATKQEQ